MEISPLNKAEGEKAMKKNETKKKTMMAGGDDGGACGQKKVGRHAKDTAL